MKLPPVALALLVLLSPSVAAAPLDAPDNLTAQRVGEGVLLVWDGVEGATAYRVYRNGSPIGNTTQESFTDSTASSSMTIYWVTALLPDGESPPSNPSTPDGPCAGPSLDFPFFYVNPDWCWQWVWWIVGQVGA